MNNNNFIVALMDQAKAFFELANESEEQNERFYVPALNYLDAAYILAEYPLPIDFEKESGLKADDSIDLIMEEVFEICGLARNKRSEKEIENYLKEAQDKVWYCRTTECENETIEKERLKNVDRIEKTYGKELDRLCDERIGDWEYGYVSGILAALRWVQGEEKDSLDT